MTKAERLRARVRKHTDNPVHPSEPTCEDYNPLSIPKAATTSPAVKLTKSLPSTLCRTPAPVLVVLVEADVVWDVAEWDVVFAPDEVAEDEVTDMEDEVTDMEIDVVAKLIDVLWDAAAQSWFASDSAGEMLLGQFEARQDVRFCAKVVELPAT